MNLIVHELMRSERPYRYVVRITRCAAPLARKDNKLSTGISCCWNSVAIIQTGVALRITSHQARGQHNMCVRRHQVVLLQLNSPQPAN